MFVTLWAKNRYLLVEMASASDDFESIYQSNAPLIYRFMLWRTKDQMLAEDLTSNVFEKAWRTRKNFTGGSVKAWLFRIASTTLIDHWRKNKEVIDDGDAISGNSQHANPELGIALDQKMLISEMKAGINKLPKTRAKRREALPDSSKVILPKRRQEHFI